MYTAVAEDTPEQMWTGTADTKAFMPQCDVLTHETGLL